MDLFDELTNCWRCWSSHPHNVVPLMLRRNTEPVLVMIRVSQQRPCCHGIAHVCVKHFIIQYFIKTAVLKVPDVARDPVRATQPGRIIENQSQQQAAIDRIIFGLDQGSAVQWLKLQSPLRTLTVHRRSIWYFCQGAPGTTHGRRVIKEDVSGKTEEVGRRIKELCTPTRPEEAAREKI